MSTILSRRALVTSAPAAALAATLPAAASSHPDAELTELEALLVAAVEHRDLLSERSDMAYEGHQDPPMPEVVFWREGDAWMVWSQPERLDGVGPKDRERYTFTSDGVLDELRSRIARWKAARSTLGASLDDQIARIEEIIAGVETWQAERDTRLAACGYTAAEDAYNAQCGVIDGLLQRIAMTPARTAEGVCVKARAALEASIGDIAFIEQYRIAPLLAKADRGARETAKLLSLCAMVDAAKLGGSASSERRAA